MPSFEIYIETLYKKIVGGLNCPPFSFYTMTVEEALLMIEGNQEQQEIDYNLMLTAMYNATGAFHGGKKFKFIEPFKEEKKKSKPKKTSVEEHNATLDFLKNKFNM